MVLKPAKINRTMAVVTHVTLGLRPTNPERRAHSPDSLLSGVPTTGTLGQKAQRPEGNRLRLNGPPEAAKTRINPKAIHKTIVIVAKPAPANTNGSSGMSTTKLSAKPITVGTRNARTGRVKLGTIKSAGRSVNMITMATTTPTAETGPVDLLEFNSLRSKHIRPIDVVAAEAIMGARTPLKAAHTASV